MLKSAMSSSGPERTGRKEPAPSTTRWTPRKSSRTIPAAVAAGATRVSATRSGCWEDVVNDFISLESARKNYGVAIDEAGMCVDEAATAALRAQ